MAHKIHHGFVRKRGKPRLYRKPDLFLCHSSKDKSFARKLTYDLNRVGVDVWLDEWELEAGDALHRCIKHALSQCRYVGVLLSAHIADSDWCMRELAAALSREKTERLNVVIPLFYGRAKVPAKIKGRVHLDFSKSYVKSLADLSAKIHRLSRQRLCEELARHNPKTVPEVADILAECGWDGVRLFDSCDFEELRAELVESGYECHGNTFEFPDDFEAKWRKFRRLRIVKAIYGRD